MEYTPVYEALIEAERQGRRYALVTIMSTGGGSRSHGMMAVFEDGTHIGTIGGGSAERQAVEDAASMIPNGLCGQKEYSDIGEGANAGMACGSFTVWIESCASMPQLVVFGAGHVGTALMRAAKVTGFAITLVDTREPEAIAEGVSLADRFIRISDITAETAALTLPENAFIVSTMFSHLADQQVLAGVIRKKYAYLGMIGSQKKKEGIFAGLRDIGFTQEELDRVHTPIGLPIGGETPQEIAISILAEIIQTKSERRI